MDNYNGIMKIKNENGEFYTEEYVIWLENALKETKSQLSMALNAKSHFESKINTDTRHYWDKYDQIDSSYADDEYDR